jgi:hypothetical protein
MTTYPNLLAKMFSYPTSNKMTKKQHLEYADTLTKISKLITGKTKQTYLKSIKRHLHLGKPK